MAKTFTQNEPVFSSFYNADQVDKSDSADEDQQMSEFADQLKNLRVRPSLRSVQLILNYAGRPVSSPAY